MTTRCRRTKRAAVTGCSPCVKMSRLRPWESLFVPLRVIVVVLSMAPYTIRQHWYSTRSHDSCLLPCPGLASVDVSLGPTYPNGGAARARMTCAVLPRCVFVERAISGPTHLPCFRLSRSELVLTSIVHSCVDFCGPNEQFALHCRRLFSYLEVV